jgi:3-oxoadipate enol-lactonase
VFYSLRINNQSTSMPYANVNGTKIYYELKGKGPAVVLIHGWSLNTEMWDDQFNEFSKSHKVLRYDVRGYGKSNVPDTSKPYCHHDDLKTLMDHLKIEKAAIIGLSMGGYVAINFALVYPEKTTALVPVDSWIEGHKTSKPLGDLYSTLFKKAKEEGLGPAIDYWLGFPYFRSANRNNGLKKRMRSVVGSYNGWDFYNTDPILRLKPGPAERLREVSAPTLVVVGSEDMQDIQGISDLVVSGVRNAEKYVIGDAGHMSNMEKPDEFNRVVLEFLRKSVKSN